MSGMTNNNVIWRFRNGHESLGPFGEYVWSNVIAACGFFYVQWSSLPALRNKGPRLQGADYILPDFDISTGRRRVHMDSKCKTQVVRYRNANELRHGFNQVDLNDYQAVAAINRARCVIGVIELFAEDGTTWSGCLLAQTLAKLGPFIPGFSDQEHMGYWPRNSFSVIKAMEPLELWEAANGGDVDVDRKRIASVLDSPSDVIQTRMF